MEKGVPVWGKAVVDLAEQTRRLDENRARLERLQKNDPGGDLTL
jgi:hypothetical protein